MPTRARLKTLAVMLTSSLLAACGTPIVGIADSACSSFKPIAMSKADTEPTKRQIVGHNKAFDAICPGQGSAPAKVASAANG